MSINIKELKPWEVIEYYWGTVVKHRKGKITKIYLKPDGTEIDCEKLNIIVHDNGIEFLRGDNNVNT